MAGRKRSATKRFYRPLSDGEQMLGQLLEEWIPSNGLNQRNHQSRSVKGKTPWNFSIVYLQGRKKHLPSRRQDDIIAGTPRQTWKSQLEDKRS